MYSCQLILVDMPIVFSTLFNVGKIFFDAIVEIHNINVGIKTPFRYSVYSKLLMDLTHVWFLSSFNNHKKVSLSRKLKAI